MGLARMELARMELARMELARMGLAHMELAHMELARMELARMELAHMGLARMELARMELARMELARTGLARMGLRSPCLIVCVAICVSVWVYRLCWSGLRWSGLCWSGLEWTAIAVEMHLLYLSESALVELAVDFSLATSSPSTFQFSSCRVAYKRELWSTFAPLSMVQTERVPRRRLGNSVLHSDTQRERILNCVPLRVLSPWVYYKRINAEIRDGNEAIIAFRDGKLFSIRQEGNIQPFGDCFRKTKSRHVAQLHEIYLIGQSVFSVHEFCEISLRDISNMPQKNILEQVHVSSICGQVIHTRVFIITESLTF